MKVILFGASGMIGQGVLRECLGSPLVDRILVVGRTTVGVEDPKLRELVHPDLMQLDGVSWALAGYDACFFALGVSSGGMKPEEYERITYELTLSVARRLAELNPGMIFTYVSGAGTDSSEKGRTFWARVKGKTENALLRVPFRAAYMLRPGLIQPVDGAVSRTPAYRVLYTLLGPLLPTLHTLFPRHIVTTAELGQVMLLLAKKGYPRQILETADLRALLKQA